MGLLGGDADTAATGNGMSCFHAMVENVSWIVNMQALDSYAGDCQAIELAEICKPEGSDSSSVR